MNCPECGYPMKTPMEYCPYCHKKIGRGEESDISVNWFFVENNQKRGPYKKEQIIDYIRKSEITGDTLVWTRGMKNWTQAEDSPLNDYINEYSPSIPLSALSDGWIWALATVPLLCSWILSVLHVPSEGSLMIVLILNCIFLSLDMKEVKKSGRNVSKWLWTGLILVPVYIFVRIFKTSKRYAPGIVNCVMLFISLFI